VIATKRPSLPTARILLSEEDADPVMRPTSPPVEPAYGGGSIRNDAGGAAKAMASMMAASSSASDRRGQKSCRQTGHLGSSLFFESQGTMQSA